MGTEQEPNVMFIVMHGQQYYPEGWGNFAGSFPTIDGALAFCDAEAPSDRIDWQTIALVGKPGDPFLQRCVEYQGPTMQVMGWDGWTVAQDDAQGYPIWTPIDDPRDAFRTVT